MDASMTNPGRASAAAFIYILPSSAVVPEEWRYLCARSADSALCVAPLLEGLTVESGFEHNVMWITGLKTSGPSCDALLTRLSPSYFYPSVFIFHGGEAVPPTSRAPNLSRLCARARSEFGFSEFDPDRDFAGWHETSAEEICRHVQMEPATSLIYLVTTAAFKEGVYLANTFAHWGLVEQIAIGGHKAARVPLYPIQMMLQDQLKLARNPFKIKKTAFLEGTEAPTPFFNRQLGRLLFDHVVSPSAVAVRTREAHSVAAGLAYLALDDKFENCLLAEKNFLALRPPGGKPPPEWAKTATECRAADAMAAELALNVTAAFEASVHDPPSCAYPDWPLFQQPGVDRVAALSEYYTRIASHAAALIFSGNSCLYMTEVGDARLKSPGRDSNAGREMAPTSPDRFFLFNGLFLGPAARVDAEGKLCRCGDEPKLELAWGKAPEFTLHHLAYACGFCPSTLARVMFYLERCDRTVSRADPTTLLQYLNAKTEEGACDLCDVETRHVCPATTFFKVKSRLPLFSSAKRGGIVITGAVNTPYNDCELLGNYASFNALRRSGEKAGGGDGPRGPDSYRRTNDRLLSELGKAGYVDLESGEDSPDLDRLIVNRSSFVKVVSDVNRLIHQEGERFVQGISEDCEFKFREAARDATHLLTVSLNPYHAACCPFMTQAFYRSLGVTVQDMALGQCASIVTAAAVDSKSGRNAAQPVLKKKFLGMLNKGFFNTRDVTAVFKAPGVAAFDVTAPLTERSERQYEFEIGRLNLLCPRDLRLKHRILFRGAAWGESTRGGRFGHATQVLNRAEKVMQLQPILNGPHGYLLKRFHERLFPTNKAISAMAFWNRAQNNKLLLASSEQLEDILQFVGFVRREHQRYMRSNVIQTPPPNLYAYAQFALANYILDACGQTANFIGLLVALVTGTRRINPDSAVHLLGPKDRTPAAALTAVESAQHHEQKSCLNNVCYAAKWVTAQLPLVTCPVSVSKYTGQQGGDTLYQCGNLTHFANGGGVDPAAAIYDFNKRFFVCTPRVGNVIKASSAAGDRTSHEGGVVLEAFNKLLQECPANLITELLLTLVKHRGAAVRNLSRDDFLSLTQDPYLAEAMTEAHASLVVPGAMREWTVAEALCALGNEAPEDGEDEEGVSFDFEGCGDSGMEECEMIEEELSEKVAVKRRAPQEDLLAALDAECLATEAKRAKPLSLDELL
ncbi:F-UL29 protein [Chelonid alphaherpesvirus 5]|uniref:F-UL29 protein n=1 Tax=Chelonid alphaherpesvirus 5 TaxID=702736 RepID=V5NYS1_9ALPH|nr:F-UL29 protein [Chelonid alphaherpesvirus 5]AHA93358.1 F-UL29 protein [Chelonid alphaherpesvirus 5]